MRVRLWHLALAPLVACAGCDLGKLVENITTHSELGVIAPDSTGLFPTTSASVVVPDTATHGVAFTVTIMTGGDSCIKGIDRTDVNYVASDTVVLRPYDLIGVGCPIDVVRIAPPHTASIMFGKPGPAVIRVEGAKDRVSGTLVTITRKVTIR